MEKTRNQSQGVTSEITDDQTYLRDEINTLAKSEAHKNRVQPPNLLTVAGVERLNDQYGTAVVVSSMRLMHGFPPEGGVRYLYSYLEALCKTR